MHPGISKSYIVPAILLNPVLFLISLNTILSRLLPPIIVDAAKQPPPYSTFGPSAEHPHLNIHASEKLCWSYTFLIVCAQLAAFGKVSQCRGKDQVRARMKGKRIHVEASPCNGTGKDVYLNGTAHAIRLIERVSKSRKHEDRERGSFGPVPNLWHLEASDEDSTHTSESETLT